MNDPILLDTCAAIWLSDGSRMESDAKRELAVAYSERQTVFISPITAWEVGMLVSRGRYKTLVGPQTFFDRLLDTEGFALAELSPRLLIASSYLPGEPPRDPTDRIIIATAREHGFRIMTRDRPILAYAEQQHVRAIAC